MPVRLIRFGAPLALALQLLSGCVIGSGVEASRVGVPGAFNHSSVASCGPGWLGPERASASGGAEPPADGSNPSATTQRARRVIYRGQFVILVPDANAAIDRFVERIESLGGYLESRRNDRVVCRVPVGSFREVVDRLGESGRVLDRTIESEDVTKRTFDLETRIESAEAGLRRLRALLARAEKVEEVLAIEGVPHRYLLTLFVIDGVFDHTVRIVEFAAPEGVFDAYLSDVRESIRTVR